MRNFLLAIHTTLKALIVIVVAVKKVNLKAMTLLDCSGSELYEFRYDKPVLYNIFQRFSEKRFEFAKAFKNFSIKIVKTKNKDQ